MIKILRARILPCNVCGNLPIPVRQRNTRTLTCLACHACATPFGFFNNGKRHRLKSRPVSSTAFGDQMYKFVTQIAKNATSMDRISVPDGKIMDSVAHLIVVWNSHNSRKEPPTKNKYDVKLGPNCRCSTVEIKDDE